MWWWWWWFSRLLQPHGLKPARLLCPWDFPGNNSGAGGHCLLQGIFPAQGLGNSYRVTVVELGPAAGSLLCWDKGPCGLLPAWTLQCYPSPFPGTPLPLQFTFVPGLLSTALQGYVLLCIWIPADVPVRYWCAGSLVPCICASWYSELSMYGWAPVYDS